MSRIQSENEIIRVENLYKTFITPLGEATVLQDINMSVYEGEIFGIIGLSGAGKSTLVRCINHIEKPTDGRVIVAGKDLSAVSPKELLKLRQKMGMIFQGFNLLAQRDALGNVCYPLEIAGVSRAAAQARAKELLELVGLGGRIHAYPAQLSGGQKQRVAIARAMANDPKVLLCDEATSALDPTTTRSILELLQKINRDTGVTILIITHEMKLVEQICDRVAVIDQSHIVEMGDVHEVFVHPRSPITKKLVLPLGEAILQKFGNKCLRLQFDNDATDEPIISSIAIECSAAVNILSANTELIRQKRVGHMLIQLPEDAGACERIKRFLEEKSIRFSEEAMP